MIVDKIKKAKIQLQADNPFFSYLSLFIKEKETEDLPDWAGMGVDERGNLYYKKEFVEKLSDNEVRGVLCHEILHLALLHLLRRGKRDSKGWNISADLVVNSILRQNNFELPDKCCEADDDEIVINGKTIEEISKKTAEQIYNEIPKNKKNRVFIGESGDNGNSSSGNNTHKKRFDKHIESLKKDKNMREKARAEEEKWLNRIEEGYMVAKMRGKTPLGIERLIGKLHQSKIKWRKLLNKYLTNMIPRDYSWAKPHKKSISVESYLPCIKKEKIEIAVVIDVSGSIQQKELNDFLSEVVGIAKAYRENVDMTLLTHETSVNDKWKISNGNIKQILDLKIKGGGGTTFSSVLEYLEKDKDLKSIKGVVWLTDGEGDEIKRARKFDLIWVLSKGGTDKLIKDSGKVIKLEDE